MAQAAATDSQDGTAPNAVTGRPSVDPTPPALEELRQSDTAGSGKAAVGRRRRLRQEKNTANGEEGDDLRLARGQGEQDGEVEVDLRPGGSGVPLEAEGGTALGGVADSEGAVAGADVSGGGTAGDEDGYDEDSSEHRKRRRKRRIDVYSYFAMALVRALEAQAGTMSWLKRVCIFPPLFFRGGHGRRKRAGGAPNMRL